jgi:hypothetical protein
MGIWDDYPDEGKGRGVIYILLIALIIFFSLVAYRAYDLKRREVDLKLRLSESRFGSMEAQGSFSIHFLSSDHAIRMVCSHTPRDPLFLLR